MNSAILLYLGTILDTVDPPMEQQSVRITLDSGCFKEAGASIQKDPDVTNFDVTQMFWSCD